MKLRIIPAALCACSLLVVAGCNKGGNTTNKTLVNTNTTTTTNTSNASQPAASPQPTATGTDVGRSLKSAKPEDAAQGLFSAWKAKDRAAASKYASDSAIKTLFEEGGAEGLEFQGCNKDEDGGDFYNCAYTYEGGAVFMQVTGNDADGYKVTGAGFVAD
ncbi:MAG TPA: hypothetical protein VJT74_02770 [Pyrinomonadaceae bacterium]|nr:hypothetical protein [Pyrinomonadaceae bacterium]